MKDLPHPKFWKLQGKLAVPCRDMMEWARWFEANHHKKQVAETQIGPVYISTVFLGLDHRYFGEGDPLLFETMIFRGGDGQDQWRYSTWQEAEEGHARAVAAERAKIKDKVND